MTSNPEEGELEEQPRKRPTLAFLTSLFGLLGTLPGIVTGAAALIAAILGIFRVTQGHLPFTASPTRPQPAVTATATSGAGPPAATAQNLSALGSSMSVSGHSSNQGGTGQGSPGTEPRGTTSSQPSESGLRGPTSAPSEVTRTDPPAGASAAADSTVRMFSSLGPIAFESRRSGNLDIYTVNPDGSGEKQLTFDPANDREPAWSADGRRIAFVSSRGQGDDEIYVMDWNGANQRDVSNHSPGTDSDPAWSPDGQRIVFTKDQDIYTVNADGTGLKPIVTGPAIDYHPSWSPDGIHIAFNSNRSGNADIYMINADGSGPTTQLTNNPSQDYSPAWSPDGQRVAFYSFRDSNWEIYVLNVSDGGATPRRLTSSSSTDASPTWSSDGQWIAYQFSIDNTSVHDEIDAINVNVPSAPVRVDALGAENDHPSW